MKVIKIIVSFMVVILAMILANFKPIEEKVEVDVEEVLSLPTISDLVDAEIKRIEQEKLEEEIKQEKAHTERLEELERQRREDDRRRNTVSRGVIKPVSRNNASMKTYMPWKAITNKSSKQYQLQQHSDIYTDEEGFRKIDDKFMIAIGTYFQAEVGQEVEVELSSGNKFSAYVGDIKANKHTDGENMQDSANGSIVEFIVDNDKLEDVVRKMGDCSYSSVYNFLQGDVVSITILEGSVIE